VSQTVSVRVDEYLEFERMRFESRLQVERRIARRVLPLAVPPMLLQTLVENAVKTWRVTPSRWGRCRDRRGRGRLDTVDS
jgi:LytS/YehU family sensor histidine kinase